MSSFLHLGQSLLIGCCLGLFYGFLRPFRPRWLGELLFLVALFHGWFYLIFGLCNLDPRLAYTFFLIVGIFLWETTFGMLLRPVFSSFWHYFYGVFWRIWRIEKKLLKKCGIFLNFLFARSKKWVTIKCNLHPSDKTENRRKTYGKKKSLPPDPAGLSPQSYDSENSGAGHHFGFRRRTAGPSLRYGRVPVTAAGPLHPGCRPAAGKRRPDRTHRGAGHQRQHSPHRHRRAGSDGS